MSSGLAAGFLLDQQWHWMRGEMETTKKPALAALVRVLDSANVSYAIIGGEIKSAATHGGLSLRIGPLVRRRRA